VSSKSIGHLKHLLSFTAPPTSDSNLRAFPILRIYFSSLESFYKLQWGERKSRLRPLLITKTDTTQGTTQILSLFRRETLVVPSLEPQANERRRRIDGTFL